jgi:hypothetical protein
MARMDRRKDILWKLYTLVDWLANFFILTTKKEYQITKREKNDVCNKRTSYSNRIALNVIRLITTTIKINTPMTNRIFIKIKIGMSWNYFYFSILNRIA